MTRLGSLVILLVIAIVVILVVWYVKASMRNTKRSKQLDERERALEGKMRSLAQNVPQALDGAPLLNLTVDQGEFLGAAEELFNGLLKNDIDVFMPTEYSSAIQDWKDEYNLWKEHSK